jgi:hypothetical protein
LVHIREDYVRGGACYYYGFYFVVDPASTMKKMTALDRMRDSVVL